MFYFRGIISKFHKLGFIGVIPRNIKIQGIEAIGRFNSEKFS